MPAPLLCLQNNFAASGHQFRGVNNKAFFAISFAAWDLKFNLNIHGSVSINLTYISQYEDTKSNYKPFLCHVCAPERVFSENV